MKNVLIQHYKDIRSDTEVIASPLETEDYVVQPMADVSPPKWHLGHTTWFFETFILKPHWRDYELFDPKYNFVFNSYYETVGARVIRTDRGNLSRPTVAEVYAYRAHVDAAMERFLIKTDPMPEEIESLLQLGLQHEQQHQELLWADIKYILGHNPLFPTYVPTGAPYPLPLRFDQDQPNLERGGGLISVPEGVYEVGHNGEGFCFDNELARHKTFIHGFDIAVRLINNREYLDFIADGGYQDFKHWHADGWDWVKRTLSTAPLYWHFIDDTWMYYTLHGLCKIDPLAPVCHVNYFEAAAFASWKGMRLPTESEWEVASAQLDWGDRWEWTGSAYLPYPGFKKEASAIGEYNGKFMVSQQVLRGGSVATPLGHSRATYRNFFYPNQQVQFTGIRLVNGCKVDKN